MVEPENAPRWVLPDGVKVDPNVSLDAEDPALDGGRRHCIALTRAGKRCPTSCPPDSVLCQAHAGRLDGVAGGHARARSLRLVREEARNRQVEARLGAQAIIAARAIERASDLRRAFDAVLDGALAGDKAQARTLLGYLQAAFPHAPSEARHEDASPLTSMSTEELRRLAFAAAEPNGVPPTSS